MSKEASKNRQRRFANGDFDLYFQGNGLDIGAGDDPVLPNVQVFDRQHGNAAHPDLPAEHFDFVHSSHCLEHMKFPGEALLNWWRLVKPGGFLIVTVPDFVLYEKRHWPSQFNPEHTMRFSFRNLLNIVQQFLTGYQLVRLQLNDAKFNYLDHTSDQTRDGAQAEIELILWKVNDVFWANG